jgi:hypothetical protein
LVARRGIAIVDQWPAVGLKSKPYEQGLPVVL